MMTAKKLQSNAYHSGDSEADNSQTPQWLINQIQDIANVNFVHDVCARENSAKAGASFWTKELDALKQDWLSMYEEHQQSHPFIEKSAFWMNPPFSLADEFTTKAADAALDGVVTLGCCVHAPDRDWFQAMEKRATVIYVPDGRIQFLTHDGKPFTRWCKKTEKQVRSGANFPLCFPLWTPFNTGGEAKQVRFKRDKDGYS